VTGRAVQAVDGESEVWSGEPPHDQGGGGPRHREAGRSQYGGDTAAAVAATVRMVRTLVIRMVRAPAVRAMRRLGGLPGELVACGVGPKRALDSVRGVSAVALPGRLAVRRGRETSHGQEHCQQEG
jgi:hypothetical protein